jgi:hypothetical protein
MVASALIAYFLGPGWGFGFAATVGPAFGWVFAAAYAGRAPELERRADRALANLLAQARARMARRRELASPGVEEITAT